jgi:hypothetical protein
MSDLAGARFDLIAPLLRRYKRRFTVLDLGAGINPYMAQRISREFDCVMCCIEQDEIAPEELAKFGPRALWLRKKMSVDDLERLACCEHFDVVLALNILHHFGAEWKRALVALRKMSTHSIVQTPHPSDKQTCGQDITESIHAFLEFIPRCGKMGESIQFESHLARPIYELGNGEVKRLTMSSWTSPTNCNNNIICADFASKSIELRHKTVPLGMDPTWGSKVQPFIHGLNLWNFAQLNGQWPRKETVLKLIREFPLRQDRHGDITPHNFLFDGAELHLIDGYEGWEFDDRENLLKTERMMEEVLR